MFFFSFFIILFFDSYYLLLRILRTRMFWSNPHPTLSPTIYRFLPSPPLFPPSFMCWVCLFVCFLNYWVSQCRLYMYEFRTILGGMSNLLWLSFLKKTGSSSPGSHQSPNLHGWEQDLTSPPPPMLAPSCTVSARAVTSTLSSYVQLPCLEIPVYCSHLPPLVLNNLSAPSFTMIPEPSDEGV